MSAAILSDAWKEYFLPAARPGLCISFDCTYRKYILFHNQNNKIQSICIKAGERAKQYIPHYTTESDWKNKTIFVTTGRD
jgi:hypothetical protein